MNVLTFIATYWYLIIAFIAIISVVSIKTYIWFKKPSNEQMKQIQEWLLFAVAKAEAKLGSGTGQLKLRLVYDMFIAKFPAAAPFISFESFRLMVEKALDEFEELIKSNKNIEALYKTEEGSQENEDK